ncbi:PAS domain-containing protein [Mangrovimicrobium sediminis]|uniref:histidine kinase n=2 Tax=Mangrovimicrobium sediminis TaxID=2562682 RepID=A0A4Z0M4M5_9GAMM|nr:PAS domain-containing protein [Haliea sp. SAOS-164]
MEAVYADLVQHQVELEIKNSELEETHKFVNSVLSAMTDVLLACDTNGTIEQVNAALEQLTGKPADAFLLEPLASVFSAECAEKVAQISQVLRRELVIDIELNVRCADNSTTPLALNCSPRYDHDGRVVGMVLIGRPVGELRRAYDQLKQTQQQLVHSEKMASLGRLVAGVAHELNNPISFVFGNMHVLKRYGSRITQYLQKVEEMHGGESLRALQDEYRIDRILGDMEPLIDGTLEGAERISEIVQDLRRYSGGQREPAETIDLTATIHKAVEWVVRASRIQPEVDYVLPEELELETRKGQVHQILVNLIQNALDAMGEREQPRLLLRCEQREGKCQVSVTDNGPGIADHDLPHIFEPFFTNKPVGQGTGLGLYISYGLAQELGGDLTARNVPEAGACFTLTLPL